MHVDDPREYLVKTLSRDIGGMKLDRRLERGVADETKLPDLMTNFLIGYVR